MNKTCPHCGAALPEEASFCPGCARSVSPGVELRPPVIVRRSVVYTVLAVILLAALLLGGWLYFRPKTYDGVGQVIYKDRDGSYQLLAGWLSGRYMVVSRMIQNVESDAEHSRFPVALYVNRMDANGLTGTSYEDANLDFMDKVDHVTAEVLDQENVPGPVTLTLPEHDADYAPDAARISYVDFSGKSEDCQMVFTFHMKNGDIIRLRQNLVIELIPVHHYYPEDVPMDTTEDLQALIDSIYKSFQVGGTDIFYIHLPPVTYEGELSVDKWAFNLCGSEDGDGNRTAFTGTVRLTTWDNSIIYIDNIDFIGNGSGIGISASNRLHLTNCTVSGWETGVLGYGTGCWVNFNDCVFAGNTLGFHFNATGQNVSHTLYYGNTFRGNGTGILLESVPTDVELDFGDSVFEDNGTDIDNRCGQSVTFGGAQEE